METTQSPAKEVTRGGGMLIFLGIGLVIFGILAMGAPFLTGIAATMVVGTLVLLGGIFQLAFAFRAKSLGAGVVQVVAGGLTALAGIVILANPEASLAFLTLFLAAYFLIHGITEIVTAFQIRPLQGWSWALFSGILAVLLAILIWRQWPISGLWAIGLLVGIKILMNGTSMIALGCAARGVARAMK